MKWLMTDEETDFFFLGVVEDYLLIRLKPFSPLFAVCREQL